MAQPELFTKAEPPAPLAQAAGLSGQSGDPSWETRRFWALCNPGTDSERISPPTTNSFTTSLAASDSGKESAVDAQDDGEGADRPVSALGGAFEALGAVTPCLARTTRLLGATACSEPIPTRATVHRPGWDSLDCIGSLV